MKKKILSIIIIGMFLLSLFMATSASENEAIVVLSDGNTLYVGGSGPGNYTNIQDAINDSFNGDTVFVYNGTYLGDIVVNKSINLIGQDRDNTIIDHNESGYVVNIAADWVNISGFKITGSIDTIGISIDDNCGNNSISENIINNSLCGIYTIAKFNSITDNIITNSIFGIAIRSKNYVFDNTVINCNGSGIFISDGIDNHIINNIIKNNSYGIVLFESEHYSSNNNFIIDNTLSSNYDYGIYIMGGCDNNTIYHNNFINNTEHAYDEGSNYWNDSYPNGGNYWDNYTGEDNNGDGIGDTPYNISGGKDLNKDYYPLMQPYGSVEFIINIAPFDFGKISVFIKNKESSNFSNVEWHLSVTGGLFRLINIHTNDTIETLNPDMPEKITSGYNSIARRLGKVTIDVEVNAGPYSFTQTFYGFVLGRLFLDRTYQILNS